MDIILIILSVVTVIFIFSFLLIIIALLLPESSTVVCKKCKNIEKRVNWDWQRCSNCHEYYYDCRGQEW